MVVILLDYLLIKNLTMKLKIQKLKIDFRFFLFGVIMIFSGFASAQSFTVTGKVTGSDGTALIGASVKMENTSIGTITDLDGNYTLNITSSASNLNLVFSYVGYSPVTKTVAVVPGGKTTLDVVLNEDYIGLDEVVITGASAATTKKQYGNAISTVNSREIEQAGALSIDRALSGKISGAIINQNSGNPDGGVSVTLRGYSTIVGQSDPLYIVDGVIIDNSSDALLDLGGFSQNRLADINPNDIDHIEILKGAAAAAIYGSQASNGIVQIFTKKGQLGKPKVSFSTSANMNTLRKEIHENMYPKVWANSDIHDLTQNDVKRYKMQDYVFSPGYGNENALSISGGAKNTKYYASLASYYNEGIMDNTNFNRYSARLNLDQILNKWISVSVGLNYINSKSRNVPNGGINKFYGALTGMNFNNNTYDPEPDENGNYASPAGWVPNPLEAINNFKFFQNTNRMLSNVKFKFALMEGLNVNFNVGSDWYNQDATAYIPLGSHGAANGYARAALKNFQRLNADFNINYITEFGDFLKSTSALGMSAQRDKRHVAILTSDKISPFVETVSGDITGKTDATGERSIQGLYIQQTFGLWDKLFITGAVRWDQASPFGINSRTQFYPKASVSYLVSDNDFWKDNLGVFNTFKIRASYGESGNMSALSDYERFSNYGDVNYLGALGFVPSTAMGNENVKPERQKETEFGIDFSMFNGRFGGEFSYYNVDVSDLLLQIELAPSTGFASRYENIGTMNNKGIELSLKGVPVKSKDLSWIVSGTFSKNKNVVNDIPGDQVTLHNTFGIVRAINGQPLGVHYGYYYERNEDGSIWLDDNGLPKRAVNESGTKLKKVIADPNPDFVASLINELEYKNFTFRFQFDQVQGFDVFNFTDRVNTHPAFAGGHYDEDELKGLLPKGYNKAAYNIWERYIEDGSFIKLRELYLGYKFNPGTLGISNLNVYISGRNLYSFDKYLGWDPETSTAGQSNGVRGFDFNEVPIPRTFKIGLNATF